MTQTKTKAKAQVANANAKLADVSMPNGSTNRHIVNSGYGNYGASYAKKSLLGWFTHAASADEDIVDNIKTLRARSRDLYMGSPLATSAIKTIRTSVVGSGLMMSSHIDADFLGLTREQAEAWQKKTEREWLLWAEDVNCDASKICNFYEFQALALISALMSGDCFIALPMIHCPHCAYDLKMSLIEADRICDPVDKVAIGNSILEGVEIGTYGEPVAYWIAKYHPNGTHRPMNNPLQSWKRIPAFSQRTGRRNILHLMCDVERPNQRRGVPLLAPVIEHFKQLGRYTEAELVAAVVSGFFTVFITQDNPEAGIDTMFSNSPLDASSATPDPDDVALGNGGIVNLAPGEKIETANPGRPNTAFDGFVTAIIKQIGAALEVPYELLIKSFNSNYSASRAAILEAWRTFRMRRQWLVNRLCQPVYEAWLAEAVAKGRILAPGFNDDPVIRKAWCTADWAGDTPGQLDPVKEVNAAIARVNAGLSTREREAAELNGMKFDTIAAQLGREKDLLEEYGLVTAPQEQNTQLQEEKDDNEKQS